MREDSDITPTPPIITNTFSQSPPTRLYKGFTLMKTHKFVIIILGCGGRVQLLNDVIQKTENCPHLHFFRSVSVRNRLQISVNVIFLVHFCQNSLVSRNISSINLVSKEMSHRIDGNISFKFGQRRLGLAFVQTITKL